MTSLVTGQICVHHVHNPKLAWWITLKTKDRYQLKAVKNRIIDIRHCKLS